MNRQIEARPYPLPIDAASTAVVVVDMQQGFGGDGGWWDVAGVEISGIQAVVPNIRRVVDSARSASIPVVYLHMDLEGSESRVHPRLTHYYAAVKTNRHARAAGLRAGVRQSDILPEIARQPGDIVIEKPEFSGFYQTDLDERLRALGVATLVFTGCTTSICVDSTLRDAVFRGYDCVLLEDCCAEPIGHQFGRSNHDATVYQVETLLGWVGRSEAFVTAVEAAVPVVTG